MKQATSPSAAPRAFLTRLFDAAIAAANPGQVVPPALPRPPKGRTVVIGAGKASAGMAAALEAHWSGPLEGLVITRHGQGREGAACRRIEIVEAAHPIPDAAGREATDRLMSLLSGLGKEDLVIALISGGGSSLLSKPLPGMTFEQKQEITRALLRSGATIGDMNIVRQHLSAVKGGRLAALAAPAPVVTLLISDVPGDLPETIASGPTLPPSATRADALAIIDRFGIDLPKTVRALLDSPAADSPAPEDPRFAANTHRVIASASQSLNAAKATAEAEGVRAVVLSDRIEGEAREVAKVLSALALACRDQGAPFSPPVVLLSGGETTVTVSGTGRGGRNSEFGLSSALVLQGIPHIHGLAADTDGIDGMEENAGVFLDGATVARLHAQGLDPQTLLGNNDAYRAFSALGDLLVTGPTGTNVNDFRAFYITTEVP
ncbi:MAG: glycerate kinase [Rhodospirillum sp.]|nr:glycerate kinase [Rhodospirillum sp.]MCF8489726.1 glycerate kinase [Rhodospirillum sp.]